MDPVQVKPGAGSASGGHRLGSFLCGQAISKLVGAYCPRSAVYKQRQYASWWIQELGLERKSVKLI